MIHSSCHTNRFFWQKGQTPALCPSFRKGLTSTRKCLWRVCNTWRMSRIRMLNIVIQVSKIIHGLPVSSISRNPTSSSIHEDSAQTLAQQLMDDVCPSNPFCTSSANLKAVIEFHPHEPGTAPVLERSSELIAGVSHMMAPLSLASQIECLSVSRRPWMPEFMTLLPRDRPGDVIKGHET